ncbi:retinaldehyde-binding protein 1-like isoform X1 [Culex pipiens pallens]|uniref:retinaldehyde-binding protein 1-like isoform X1 n=1 Tax=Culex pipiens pallens TaxID=42434 RepID=UPI001953D121|nr:retinaldehyde-binding protein 1-like isoform X1 [Culex pipiens pallens]
MASFTVEKCPQTYDEYNFVLDALHLEKARIELNETDENRAQSLAQMREWIAKHPHIGKCRTDSVFLLRFLRMRKFSVPMAQESLERYLIALRSFPQWFKNLDPLNEEIRLFNKVGMLFNLGFDSHGRTVVLFRPRVLNVLNREQATIGHQMRQAMLLLETTIEEETSQINGYVAIADFEAITLKLLSVWSLTDVSNAAESLFQSFPLRIQEIHAICVPRFFKIFADLALSCMSEKIRNRVYCHKSLDDAMKHLELSLLTTDYEGGTQNPDQLTEDFIKCAERKRTQLLLMDEMDIDTSRYQFGGQQNTVVSEIEAGMVGSFKKLNVD